MENMISQLFRGLPKLVYVGATSGFEKNNFLKVSLDVSQVQSNPPG